MRFACGLSRNFRANRRGQALPLVLAVVALGGLVIGPFLSHVSASLTGSRNYEALIKETYGADAGVEHGIWRLAHDGLAEQLPDVGDTITYALPNQVNSIAPSVTVTNTLAGGVPMGDITEPVLDSFEFDTVATYKPRLINIAGSVFAIAYTGSGNDGFLKTVNIASDGVITKTAIDTWEFDTGACYEPDIIRVSGNVYAIVYRGSSNNGYLKTVSIAASGAITESAVDTWNFGSSLYEPDIMLCSGNVYVIAFRTGGGAGYLRTVRINESGGITKSSVDSWNFASTAREARIMNISGNVYGVVYRGSSNAGTLRTVTISTSGSITKSAIDTWAFDSNGYTPTITRISGNVYGVSYRGNSNAGYVKTMTISTGGSITKTAISTLDFDANGGYEAGLWNVSGDIWLIAYRNSENDGVLKTYQIFADGQITQTLVDTISFDTSAGYEPNLFQCSSEVFAVVYRGPSDDGFLKTVGIAAGGGGGTPTYSVQSTAGGTTIAASVTVSGEIASIVSWLVERQ